MRSLIGWLAVVVATIAAVVCVPTLWATENVVSVNGFEHAAARAAAQPEVQDYFADQVAESVARATEIPLAGAAVAPVARTYSRSPQFVSDFTEVARQQHDWLFQTPAPGTSPHEMDLNITPMVNNVLARLPGRFTVDQPIAVTVDQRDLTAGSLEQPGRRITLVGWVSLAVAAAAAVAALLIGRRRLAVAAGLGVGALIAGGVGMAVASYLERNILDGVADGGEGVDSAVAVIVKDMMADLSSTSMIVGGVGLGVALLGGLGALIFGRRR